MYLCKAGIYLCNPRRKGHDVKLNDVTARLDDLAVSKVTTRTKIEKAKAEEVREVFDAIVQADFNAEALEAATPGIKWGFLPHDIRFLRSLRDQALGVGEQAKPLTKAQVSTLRAILLRDHYITQAALLL